MSTLKQKRLLALNNISDDWRRLLKNDALDEILHQLDISTITPPVGKIFEFARLTDLDGVKVAIIGQDPYPSAGDAHGLAFSCLTGVPASLKNIYKCLLHDGLIEELPTEGDLTYWAKQGVLLLNTALTTETGTSLAHSKLWQDYTRDLIVHISNLRPMVFLLWGGHAKKYADVLAEHSQIFTWVHPSPLAQKTQKFVDCPHFREANRCLKRLGYKSIDWHQAPPCSEVDKAFSINDRSTVVFTDGSAFPNNASPESRAGYAASFALGVFKDVILYGNLDVHEVNATNQRAEGFAMLRTMEYLNDRMDQWDTLTLVSDSEFWIKMITDYMPRWKESKFDEKCNPDLTKQLWALYNKLIMTGKTINLRHVFSHNKLKWDSFPDGSYEKFCSDNNDYVDKLAGYARKKCAPGSDVVGTAKY